MTHVISWLRNLRLRQVITVVLAGLTVFVMQAFGYTLPAQADNTVRTPEGTYYKGTLDVRESVRNDNPLGERASRILKDTTDGDRARTNLRDTADNAKRNLRDTVDNARRNIGDTVRTPEGTYYKGTPNDDENIIERAKGTAENIKNKLNLDEPLPRSTKEFLNAKPKEGEGYYKTPAR
ncbi:hypothetical protein WKK05_17510 [Nostoc sp. UHCC 0302]|uniref:hypothetical protein n=1 Tax=Nostoc sp. UHCC 0302 TaxID=3134896 RepID=UPI00311CA37D